MIQENTTELCDLFYKYKSDKCPKVYHTYSPVYYENLKNIKYNSLEVLEIGIGTNKLMKPICGHEYSAGASLRAWRDFFKNSFIYGLDIDKNVLFEEERIKCFYTDQSKKECLLSTIEEIRKFKKNPKLKFDLIIDDGSHIIDHMILSFNVLKEFLNVGGFYIIEDIMKKDVDMFKTICDTCFSIKQIHYGKFYWDAFIIYQKIK
jgi:hypothetical protein